MTVVRATIAWVLAVLLVLVGTCSLILGHRDVALAVYAHAMLFLTAAGVSSVQASMWRYTKDINGRIELHGDVVQRLRSAR